MLSFECDYNNGIAPKIFELMLSTNYSNQPGYGEDDYTKEAIKKIKDAIKKDDAFISFVCGGTQANQIVISSLLKSFEGVIGATTSHINTHEAGAIEYSGHKVIAIDQINGKIQIDALSAYLEKYHTDESKDAIVYPGMVYISQPTELGTLYTKSELEEIRAICDKYNMLLYLDGARLAYGLVAPDNDVTLSDIAYLCDAFYIGGTKCGAIIGEALVFSSSVAPRHFEAMKKQRGGMLAKGRLLAVQFDALFTNNYYHTIGINGMKRALRLKEIFEEKGYEFAYPVQTNQLFVIMENKKIEELRKNVRFSLWEKLDKEKSIVRFCTSWSTLEEDLEELEVIL